MERRPIDDIGIAVLHVREAVDFVMKVNALRI